MWILPVQICNKSVLFKSTLTLHFLPFVTFANFHVLIIWWLTMVTSVAFKHWGPGFKPDQGNDFFVCSPSACIDFLPYFKSIQMG